MSGHNRSGRVTIREVADKAGVSPSTVSRAFARPDRVSAATTKRIFAAADALGYYTEPVDTVPSRTLRGMIAIIVPDIANQFFSDIIRSVQHEFNLAGFALIVAESEESASRERAAFNKIAAYVDGVILTSSRMPDAMIRKCAQTRPIVVVNRTVRGVPSVAIDIGTGIRQAAELLVSMGFSRVTYLDGPSSSWSVGVRWNHTCEEFRKRGVSVRRIWPGLPTFVGGYALAKQYLNDPTGAVIAHNDLMALGFMAAMRRQGVRCPDDYVIIGFDNDTMAQVSDPPLSSVGNTPPKLGKTAAGILLDRLNGRTNLAQSIMIPSRLIVRESTGKAASGS